MRGEKGFTLIELIVVVAILAALAFIALPRITTSTATAKAAACATNVDIMNTQIEMYYADTGSYPTSLLGPGSITADPNYFPEGAPVCPGSPSGTGTYSMDSHNRVHCSVHNPLSP